MCLIHVDGCLDLYSYLESWTQSTFQRKSHDDSILTVFLVSQHTDTAKPRYHSNIHVPDRLLGGHMEGYWVDYDITREWPPTTPSAQPIVLSHPPGSRPVL